MPTVMVDGDRVSFTVNHVAAATIIRATGYDETKVRLKGLAPGGYVYDPTSVIDITKAKRFTILEETGADAA